MNDKRLIIRHFLATLAYRAQKALRDAPEGFADFRVDSFTRTPHELILHMTGVVCYARSHFDNCESWLSKMPSFEEEVRRFHDSLEQLARHIDSGENPSGTTLERLLQGPLSDAMTHVGQIALLRRLFGSPVPGENFIVAGIDPANLSPEQPDPVSPDKHPVKPGQEGEDEQ